MLAVFNWMCPDRALAIPDWVRQQFALPVPDLHAPRGLEEERVRLFDSRPWFAPHQPEDQPLER
ncbi:hypothetical protein [Opitutus sp. ER46]|uniref:hypothetical protein n=1 Tax=Opitutus sp. ER46 TaxID=2161864 RepID=UPI0011B26D66|nr:hypothetical protein [Opitutus sp. ER46]